LLVVAKLVEVKVVLVVVVGEGLDELAELYESVVINASVVEALEGMIVGDLKVVLESVVGRKFESFFMY
jgi:hypothetical protein